MSEKLTKRQEAFAKAYALERNATAAYRAAGYSTRGKPETTHVRAQEVLRNPKVAARIEFWTERRDKVAETKFDMTAERVLAEIAKIAFANAEDFFKWGPDGVTVKSSDELTQDQRAVVSEVSQTVTQHGGTIHVKLSDKQSALDKLARHFGLYKDTIRHADANGEAMAPTIIQVQSLPRGAQISGDGAVSLPKGSPS